MEQRLVDRANSASTEKQAGLGAVGSTKARPRRREALPGPCTRYFVCETLLPKCQVPLQPWGYSRKGIYAP